MAGPAARPTLARPTLAQLYFSLLGYAPCCPRVHDIISTASLPSLYIIYTVIMTSF
jgi:hypothetical protein